MASLCTDEKRITQYSRIILAFILFSIISWAKSCMGLEFNCEFDIAVSGFLGLIIAYGSNKLNSTQSISIRVSFVLLSTDSWLSRAADSRIPALPKFYGSDSFCGPICNLCLF